MKRYFKGILSLLLCFVFMLSFSSCTNAKKAEQAADAYLSSLQNGDMAVLDKFISESAGEKSEQDEAIFKAVFSTLEYKIIKSTEVDDSTVLVEANIETVNMVPIVKEYVETSLKLVNSGKDAKEVEEKMNKYLLELTLNENAEKTQTDVQIKVTKSDGEWKVLPDESLTFALTGGISRLLQK